MSEEEEEELNNDEIVKNNIQIFRDIVDNITGCQMGKEGDQNFFKCKACPKLGECFQTLSESVAALAYWLDNYIEETHFGKSSQKINDLAKSLLGDKIEEKEPKNDKELEHLYS